LIEKFDDAVKAAGGVEALASQATDKLNELLPGAGDAVGGLLGSVGGLLGGLDLGASRVTMTTACMYTYLHETNSCCLVMAKFGAGGAS
jgi:hypothetical protein